MKLRKKSSEKVFKRLAIFGVEGTVAPVPSVLGGLLVDLVRADQVPGIVNLLMTCQSKQLFPIRDHTLLPTFLLGLPIVEGTTTAYIAKANPSDLYQLVNLVAFVSLGLMSVGLMSVGLLQLGSMAVE